MPSKKIKVFIIDIHAVVRDALTAILEIEEKIEVISATEINDDIVAKIKKLKPDVTLIGVCVSQKPGIHKLYKEINEKSESKILVLMPSNEPIPFLNALDAGVAAYLPRNAKSEQLLNLVIKLGSDYSISDIDILRQFNKNFNKLFRKSLENDQLSPRELEVLILISQGFTNNQVAKDLFLSKKTVESHVSSILQKLELEHRTQAVLWAINKGIIDVSQVTN